MACTMSARASSFEPRLGAKPPSSPTAVLRPFFFSRPFKVWKTSAAIRTASAKVVAPTGTIMNSWRSRLLSACAPPLITFINGTGRSQACGPPRERYKGSPASSAAAFATASDTPRIAFARSEEHTSELQSRLHLVCRLLLEKKKKKHNSTRIERRERRDSAQRGHQREGELPQNGHETRGTHTDTTHLRIDAGTSSAGASR